MTPWWCPFKIVNVIGDAGVTMIGVLGQPLVLQATQVANAKSNTMPTFVTKVARSCGYFATHNICYACFALRFGHMSGGHFVIKGGMVLILTLAT